MVDTTADALKKTIQEFEPKDSTGLQSANWWSYIFERSDIAPSWSDWRRDRFNREFYRNQYNGHVQGAYANLVKSVISTPYDISGASKKWTAYYQDVIVNAQFGQYGGGWRGFCSRLILDFLTLDNGAVTEIIGGGSETGEIVGNVVGIAHLDGLRCAATGNSDYPIVYWSRKSNKLHKLNHTRVARFVDMPDGDEWAYGRGLSATSRIMATAQQFILMNKYSIQRLDDLPPAGLLMLNNVQKSVWEDARKTYTADRVKDGGDVWANVMVLLGLDAAAKIEANLLSFSNLPEHFDLQKYTEVLVNSLALELGVDPQDIWPLSGQPLGSGQQSEVLARKARGKMFGDILSMLERFINWYVLPKDMEFAFKPQDDEAERTAADIAQQQVTTANTFVQMLGSTTQARELAMRYLADTVEPFADVLLDPDGQLIELTDDDPKPQEAPTLVPPPDETTVEDVTPNATSGTDNADSATVDSNAPATGLRHTGRKDIQATRLDFESDFEDVINAANEEDITSRRTDTLVRAMVRKYVQKAYEDGLKAGGVDDAPDDDDLSNIANIVSEQSGYITDFVSRVWDDEMADVDPSPRVELWFNKSIYPGYLGGLESADKNGMYEFAGDDGDNSCDTCQRLSGQVHRLKDWARKRLRPKMDTDNFDCGGFRCNHTLVKTRGTARGSY